jgi:imidazolonepropionase
MSSLLIDNIGELLTLEGEGLGLVRDAAVAVRDGVVAFAGPRRDLPAGIDAPRIDAGGRLATPGLVEPHAHVVFAGSRAAELDLRARGATYQEIQAAGGGIASTVRATRAASDEFLIDGICARLDRFLRHGTTVVEAKSGYDLTIDGELRLLRLIAAARARHVVDLSPTLLAHLPPPPSEAPDRAAFVRAFCERAIPEAARGGLAEAVDVYCDAGAFTLDEARAILEAGRAAGLGLRAHAEQFTHTGIADVAAALGARSVEHLEELGPETPARLAAAGTVANLLPGAALTLRLRWPDARRLLAAGCRVALGTDCNPGSSLTESQPLMMSLACTQMGMTAAEAWRAVTVDAARAVARPECGRLVPGARGDVVLWDTDDHRAVPQHLAGLLTHTVVVRGAVAYSGIA